MVKESPSGNKALSRGTKRKVFIIDDLPIVRQGLTQLIHQEKDLSLCGEDVDMADAVTSIKSSNPDIAIVSISVGPSGGLKLIEDICHQFSQLPVLVLSMLDEMIYAERCLRKGAKGYIMMKTSPKEIITAIRTVLKGDIYISRKLGPKLIHRMISGGSDINNSSIDSLSNRELEVFQLIGQGIATRDIADQLNLSVQTIETYIDHIKKKMGFKSSRELFLYAVQWSITDRKF